MTIDYINNQFDDFINNLQKTNVKIYNEINRINNELTNKLSEYKKIAKY